MKAISMLKGEKDVRTFGAGDVVFAEGSAGDLMFALIDDGPRSAGAVARTPCRVTAIDAKRFSALVQQAPHFALDVMKVMAARLRRRTS